MDLYFADAKARKNFDCVLCRKDRPFRAKKLKCEESGFNNCRPMAVDTEGVKRPFCPGKSKWYPELQRTFDECLVALETGVMPKPGGIEDQDELFGECFSSFIKAYNWRRYNKVWKDVTEYGTKILEVVRKWLGGK